MVLEYILGYEVKRPVHLFMTGAFYSSIAIFVSTILFFHAPSMVIVTFMTLPAVYIITQLLKRKSLEEVKVRSAFDFIKVNLDLVEMYMFLFLGMTAGIAFWFSVLPAGVADTLLSEQIYNLHSITQTVMTGGATLGYQTIGQTASSEMFLLIAANNIKLVLLMTLLSFVFASGALFILAWNATVVGVAIGFIIRRLSSETLLVGLAEGLPLGFAYYILHIIPEIVAYFTAAIAGAMISSAMMRYDPFGPKSRKLMLIAAALMGVAILMILFGAAVEIELSRTIQMAYV